MEKRHYRQNFKGNTVEIRTECTDFCCDFKITEKSFYDIDYGHRYNLTAIPGIKECLLNPDKAFEFHKTITKNCPYPNPSKADYLKQIKQFLFNQQFNSMLKGDSK